MPVIQPVPLDRVVNGHHRCCMRCQRWYEPADGAVVPRSGPHLSGNPLLLVNEAVKSACDHTERDRFLCSPCRRTRVIRFVVLAAVMGALMAYCILATPPAP